MGKSTTLAIGNVGEEVGMEDMFDFFMPRAIRIERIGKREASGTFLLRLFDREALEDCERLDGEYCRDGKGLEYEKTGRGRVKGEGRLLGGRSREAAGVRR